MRPSSGAIRALLEGGALLVEIRIVSFCKRINQAEEKNQ
jgi:hypothetical protein